MFADLTEDDFGLIHAPIDDLAFQAGETVYGEGEAAVGIFSLRQGLLKLVRLCPDGRERIIRVLRPGDVAGLEALVTARYDSEAVALSKVAVCRVPLGVVHAIGMQSPRLQRRLMGKWQAALKEADDWLALLNFGSARQRVAQLVLKMRDPGDPSRVTLLRREDMGSILDLKLETVSREVSALVRLGVLEAQDRQGRSYRLLDADLLHAV